MKKKICLILIFLIGFGCTQKSIPLPDWVIHTQNTPETWNSVGMGLTREIAVKLATNGIASQISVQIESNIKSIKVEQNFELEEYSRSIIESRVNISLPEVKIEEVIYSNNTWYAKASLNKKKYYKLLDEKRQNAKNTAVRILQELPNLSKINELKSIYKAYEEIKSFLDIALLVDLNGQLNINLYSEIISQFRHSVQAIIIKPENNFYKLKSILPIGKHIPIQIYSKDKKSIDGIPFFVEFKSGKTNKKLSAVNNSIQLIIEKVYPMEPSDVLTIGLDLNTLLNVNELPTSFQILNTKEITIEILPLHFYIKSNETNIGKRLDHQKLNPIISQHFIESYSGVILQEKDNCDLEVSIELKTFKGNDGENEWGIFKTFADFEIVISSCQTKQELFNYSLNQIQGGDFESHKNAGSQAINNLATKLKKDILPLLDKSLSNN